MSEEHLELSLYEAQKFLHFSRHTNSKSKHCPFCIIVGAAANTYKADTNNPFAVAVLTGEVKLAHDIVNTRIKKEETDEPRHRRRGSEQSTS